MWGGAEGWPRARLKLVGPEDTVGLGGATLCSGKHLVKSAFTGLEHSSKCISFLGEKDQETKMRLFGFQANHMTCL